MLVCARRACNIDPNTFMHPHADRVVSPGMRTAAIPKMGTTVHSRRRESHRKQMHVISPSLLESNHADGCTVAGVSKV
jgi:hypothetical protein